MKFQIEDVTVNFPYDQQRVKRRRTLSSEIPHEILWSEILPRLPAKSVLRFKSVSKQWYSLLTSQMFKNTHFNHITNNDRQNPNKILLLSSSSCEFRTIDCESPELSVTRNPRPLPFTPPRPKKVVILASCHGLVCAGVLTNSDSDYFSDLILWNPLTSEFKTLSKTNYNKECYADDSCQRFGLYYSSFDNDYKLISITKNFDVYGYSLKNDSWRNMVDSTNSLKKILYLIYKCWRLCTWLDESLFFIKQDIIGYGIYGPWECAIVRFDTKTERFTEIRVPYIFNKLDDWGRATSYFLTVQRGKLHYYLQYDTSSTHTFLKGWSLNEVGKSWSCVETYMLSGLINNSIRPLYLMRNKDWVMKGFTGTECCVYRVSLNGDEKTNTTRDGDGTCTTSTQVNWNNVTDDITHEVRYMAQEVRYIETFVSPNQYV
ncbi:putative F-box/LRR-repeat/kelch-repeat protein At1g11620 [Rutidosis leptorrhynchoides]|uniref:putative F-box/LRR-repeat/kelch-repeat protein At1g11620 n=1 Tax=Rutidosis leptorrhynchoides TaxID=125765 RepID=UPI003A991ABF